MKGIDKCSCCGRYFWKSELSSLPNDFPRFKQKYCPECFPDVLETHTKIYYEHEPCNGVEIKMSVYPIDM